MGKAAAAVTPDDLWDLRGTLWATLTVQRVVLTCPLHLKWRQLGSIA